MAKETYAEWLARIQPKLDAVKRRSLPITFHLSNHLGSGKLELRTGEMASDPMTGLTVAMLERDFVIYNPHHWRQTGR